MLIAWPLILWTYSDNTSFSCNLQPVYYIYVVKVISTYKCKPISKMANSCQLVLIGLWLSAALEYYLIFVAWASRVSSSKFMRRFIQKLRRGSCLGRLQFCDLDHDLPTAHMLHKLRVIRVTFLSVLGHWITQWFWVFIPEQCNGEENRQVWCRQTVGRSTVRNTAS